MRDILLTAIIFLGLTQVISRPYVGVYLWTWLSLMNPHRLTFGFAYSLPFAQIIAGITLLGLFLGKQRKLNVWAPESVLMLILLIWVGITTFFALNPDGAFRELDRFAKTILFIFITLTLISDRQKLNWLVWIYALSLGFYGVKGGIFTIATGGSARVWGPPGSFIGGNNEVALALLMTIPLMRYLQLQTSNKILRLGLIGAMLLTSVAVLGTQSRGAFLGIMMIGLFFWWKSPYKLGASVMVGVIAGVILMFMPQSWWDRMNTIETYEQDASAMGRINAWWVAFRMANYSVTGGGANMFTWQAFDMFAPNPEDVHDVHSIYFEMLGEQGWIGLAMFLTLLLLAWIRCARLAKLGKKHPNLKWASDLGLMLQVSMIGYCTAGAFLGLAYFDYIYDLVATAIIAWKISQIELQEGTAPPQEPVPPGGHKELRKRSLFPGRPSALRH
ncbi:MAG: putative O-glycosylation ligase, exosortase A system-associated [Pseudomonadota bacterium]